MLATKLNQPMHPGPGGSGLSRKAVMEQVDLHGWTRFISMQDQCNLLQRENEREMFGLLAHQGVGAIPWSPLAGGVLTRPLGQQGTTRSAASPTVDANGRSLLPEADQAVVRAVEKIAIARGVPMAQIALAWVLKNPLVSSPIVGPTKPHHLTDAVAALDITLTPDEIAALDEHYVTRIPRF